MNTAWQSLKSWLSSCLLFSLSLYCTSLLLTAYPVPWESPSQLLLIHFLLYHNHLLSWTPLLTFSFVIIPVSQAFLFILPDDCASDLSSCYRGNSASTHANLCQCCVYYSLQTTGFFLETNIVKREMRESGTVGRNNTSKWTDIILQCIPNLIQIPLGICKNCPGQATLLPCLVPSCLPLKPAGCPPCPSDSICVDIAVAVPGKRICYLHGLQDMTPVLATVDLKFFKLGLLRSFFLSVKNPFTLLDLGRIHGDNQQLQADHNY